MFNISLIVFICLSTIQSRKLNEYCQKITMDEMAVFEGKKLLGKGAFGRVVDLGNGRVLKVLTVEKDIKREIEKILKEIDFMSVISDKQPDTDRNKYDTDEPSNDTYVLQMYSCKYAMQTTDNYVDKVKIGIEMEKLDYDFKKLINKQGGWHFLYLIDLTRKLLRGLSVMHYWGYAHLDIKPANIMMRTPFEPVLIDFGFVEKFISTNRKLSEKEVYNKSYKLGMKKGSPMFLDPEVILNGQYSFKTDIYALGVTLLSFFDYKINFNELVQGFKMKKSLEDALNPPANVNRRIQDSWPFYNESFRSKQFLPLIKKMVLKSPARRIYITDCFKILNELEKNYYAFCSRNKAKNKWCKTKEEYEEYKSVIMREAVVARVDYQANKIVI